MMIVIFGNERRLLTPFQGLIEILFSNPTAGAMGYFLSPLPGADFTVIP